MFTTTLLALMVAVTLLWLLSLKLRDASIVDIFWGTGYVLVAALGLWRSGGESPRTTVFLGLAIVWGLRLSVYLGWRNIGRGEDPRYVALRAKYGANFPLLSLPLVFIFQGVLIWVISMPLQVPAEEGRRGWTVVETVGVVLWVIGFVFETVGDWQLARFRSRPENRGRVLDRGLWALTRHPNYFGDAMVWWGLSLPAVAGGAWWTAIGPALMTWLLMRFSGVPLLERSLVASRPGYQEYMKRTNAFFPRLWPRREG